MQKVLAGVVALTGFCLGGCATIIEGTSQSIVVATNPPEATCDLLREGVMQGHTTPQNNTVVVTKSRHELILMCDAPGYLEATQRIDSTVTAAGVASIMAIDLGVTDYATGALNAYPPTVAITLTPARAPAK